MRISWRVAAVPAAAVLTLVAGVALLPALLEPPPPASAPGLEAVGLGRERVGPPAGGRAPGRTPEPNKPGQVRGRDRGHLRRGDSDQSGRGPASGPDPAGGSARLGRGRESGAAPGPVAATRPPASPPAPAGSVPPTPAPAADPPTAAGASGPAQPSRPAPPRPPAGYREFGP